MILLWGLRGDPPLDDVGEALRRARRPHLWLDQRAVLSTRVTLGPSGTTGWVETPGSSFALEAMTALYTRCYDPYQLAAVKAGGEAVKPHVASIEQAMWCFADVADITVLNRPSAMASNNSKPYQAQLIRAHFDSPDTLVTTDREAVRAFVERHRAVIYKSVSGQRSIVSRITPDHLARLDDLHWCPTQFQQHIEGRDYRVHVVGDQVFGTEVISDADDYRYASRQGSGCELKAFDLPPALAARSVALAVALGLPLAGLDLRQTPDGRWYCFEVNPSPCFTYYERHTGQPMTAAVASMLAHQ